MNNKFLVLPGCDDNNRGDQALVWESIRLAKEVGFEGKYYMLSSDSMSTQSQKEGIYRINAILNHPSEHFKNRDNRRYSFSLKMKWGIASVIDLILALPLLNKHFRRFLYPFLSKQKTDSLKVFSSAKCAIVKGGGFLHSKRGISETYKIFYFLYHINLAISYGLPVVILPNSFGSFDGYLQRILIKRTFNKCKFISARENISQRILKEQCNLSSYLSMDLGAYLSKEDKFDAFSYLKKHGVPIDQKECVSITVRPHRFTESKNPELAYKKYKSAIVDLIKHINNIGCYPVLIEHVFAENYNECDYKCIEEIEQILRNKKISKNMYSVIADRELNCRQMKSIYALFSYIVGTRFHSVIFSLFEGVPAIAITYGGNKGQGIMEDLGLQEYAIPIDKVDGQNLVLLFDKLVHNQEMIKAILEKDAKNSILQRDRLINEIKKKVII